MSDLVSSFLSQATSRLEAIAETASSGGFDEAIDLIVASLDAGGVLQAFGTGHSQAFAMEIAGRAGGLIPTNNLALRDIVLHGSRDVSVLGGSSLERDPSVVEELFTVSTINPADVFLIASNSGVNGSIVGVALRAKELGHKVIAVTSLEHTNAVEPKHPSGMRLSEIADVVLDNRAPFGDTTLTLPGDVGVGAISSITSAFIAQLLTIEVSRRISERGAVPPLYISANIPGGDEHNAALEDLYRDRIRRTA